MPEKKIPPLFDKYDADDIVIEDRGLARYMNLDSRQIHQHARHANRRFKKANLSIIERLINNLMRTGPYTGKKMKAINVVREAFAIIHEKTDENPIQVLVRAIENSAPREEATRLFLSGIYVPQAVDTAPLRRLDIALRNLGKGAIETSSGSTRSVEEALANELMTAANDDPSSYAVNKKVQKEQVAKSAR